MEEQLYEMLLNYGKSDYYPCHMPGHKRNSKELPQQDIFSMDITEIDGFDNLHHPTGIIKLEEERAARMYGAEHTFFLVNGSTAGNLSAISACVKRGGKLLVARNCHKSVYHAIYLNELQVEYIYPQILGEYGLVGCIRPEEIQKALEREPEIEAVMITSPTYDGMISDVAEIARVVHRFDIPLIVDEAHGAHFGLDDTCPRNALQQGADVVIHSLHKTLPCLTQTALLHVQGQRVSYEQIARYQSIYQSTSPSYILLSSMTRGLSYVREQGKEAFLRLWENLDWFYAKVKGCKKLKVMDERTVLEQGVFAFDRSKIIITTVGADCNGEQLSDLLRERFHIEMEMSAPTYAQAIMSIMDTREGFERLAEAILVLDKELEPSGITKKTEYSQIYSNENKPEIASSIYQSQNAKRIKVNLEEAVGKISADYIYFYPPGIPLITPGEIITEKSKQVWKSCHDTFTNIYGIDSDGNVYITTMDENR